MFIQILRNKICCIFILIYKWSNTLTIKDHIWIITYIIFISDPTKSLISWNPSRFQIRLLFLVAKKKKTGSPFASLLKDTSGRGKKKQNKTIFHVLRMQEGARESSTSRHVSFRVPTAPVWRREFRLLALFANPNAQWKLPRNDSNRRIIRASYQRRCTVSSYYFP